MDRETLKQWMANAELSGQEDSDGFLIVARGNLEFSVAYMEAAEAVVCFAPILELAGLEDAQRLTALSQSLSLNGVGNLPAGCALSYEETGDVVYLLWQQAPDQLDATRFANAFRDIETAAAQVQEHLRRELLEEADASNADAAEDHEPRDIGIRV